MTRFNIKNSIESDKEQYFNSNWSDFDMLVFVGAGS